MAQRLLHIVNSEGLRLMLALLLATATHAALVFGIHFRLPDTARAVTQLEVTLVRPNERVRAAPSEATHLAQADQLGSGNAGEQEQAARGRPQPMLAQAPPAAAPHRLQHTSARYLPRLSSRRSDWRQQTQHDTLNMPEGPSSANDSLQQLEQRLAALETSLYATTEASSALPRVRRLTAVSARSAVDAAYLQTWRQRLEQVGNTWYPEASLRYGLYGTARLLVVVRSDGSLERVEILESSGYAVLDRAALRTVRMAAPFAPFPPALRATADKLEIVRNWVFEPAA